MSDTNKTTNRDRDAAKKALARCAAELGYGGNRPYSAMVEYIAEAIAQARQEGEASAEAGAE